MWFFVCSLSPFAQTQQKSNEATKQSINQRINRSEGLNSFAVRRLWFRMRWDRMRVGTFTGRRAILEKNLFTNELFQSSWEAAVADATMRLMQVIYQSKID
mmetsp:Transcript_13244/g.37264  ORF Transcript_13244/g.37264 Transcript_13244/m.37264 type:complete len:101 (+) Transcript_13244:4107-4409(+)